MKYWGFFEALRREGKVYKLKVAPSCKRFERRDLGLESPNDDKDLVLGIH